MILLNFQIVSTGNTYKSKGTNAMPLIVNAIKGDFSDINPVDLEAGANRCAIS